MDAVATSLPDTEIPQVYRCARCGIESAERTCFIVPEPHGKPPHDTRCVTCEAERLATGTLEGIVGLIGTIFIPLLVLIAIQRGLGEITLWTVLATCLMAPIAIAAHEVGHAAIGRWVGLEVSTVVIGVGPRIWRDTIFGTCFTLHAWPLSGLTFFGARNFELLRTRLWIATLAGPATNILLALAPCVLWQRLVPVFGIPLPSLWVITNVLLGLQSLIPYRFKHASATLTTDGFALLQIPSRTAEQLEPYLFTAPLLQAYGRFEDGDFAGAEAICAQALERVPDNVHLRVLLSACRSFRLDCAGSLAVLSPLLHSHAMSEPSVRAAVENNAAFALLMSDPHADPKSDAIAEADRLSARAFALYPCVLAYRSTRALVLAARGHPEQTLALLDYSHYENANRAQRGHRETARAFALRALSRLEESKRAAAEAARLTPETVGFLKVLGLSAQISIDRVAHAQPDPRVISG
jgi:hypothetical protein